MSKPHILVPTDLTDASCSAFTHAASLAISLKGRVTLLHVDHLSGVDLTVWGETSLKDRIQNEIRQRRYRLEAFRETLEAMGAEVSAEIVTGVPAPSILEYAEIVGATFIVMARSGANTIQRLLLGSVPRKVLRGASCPVLLVEGAEDVTVKQPALFRKLLSATDFSEDSRRGLLAAADLALMLGAEITLMHAVEPPTSVVAPAEVAIPPESLSVVRERYLDLLRQQAEGIEDVPISFHVEVSSSAAKAIDQVAREKDCDLIVVPSHGKGALAELLVGSVTQSLMSVSRRPVFVFPPSYLASHYPTLPGDAASDEVGG